MMIKWQLTHRRFAASILLLTCLHGLAPLAKAQEVVLPKAPGLAERSEPQAAVEIAPDETLVLIAPLVSRFAFLVNSDGKPIHQWEFDVSGSNAYLYPDGTLMRLSQEPEIKLFNGRGSYGRIQKVDWDGNLLWDFKYASESFLQHHDFELLPNGNILFIAWEKISAEQAIASGRDPERLSEDELYPETIIEVRPEGLNGATEVWRWRLMDHLVQSHDPALPNYGEPAKSTRRVDINFMRGPGADWIHMNAVDYNADLDQIILSARYFDELWVIDHSTTTAQAATSQGGRYGHGGDLLYRMGNPMAYGHGDLQDKLIFGQHNCMWIPKGFPGEGDITIFNNGTSEPRTGYSSVEQFRLPVDAKGVYRLTDQKGFEAPETVWSYSRGKEMFSFRISGAERLENGNTLVCSGDQPWLLEVTPEKEVVWENRKLYGGGPREAEGFEDGAMFRAPGYTLEFFNEEVQQRLTN